MDANISRQLSRRFTELDFGERLAGFVLPSAQAHGLPPGPRRAQFGVARPRRPRLHLTKNGGGAG